MTRMFLGDCCSGLRGWVAMRTLLRLPLWLLAATAPLIAPTSASATPVNGCYASWSDASPVVVQQRLVAVADLTALAKRKLDGEIVRTTLCLENGHYIYKVVVRSASGAVRSITLDAHHPFAQ